MPPMHPRSRTLMHYWQEVLKLMGITGQNPGSRIKDSQILGLRPHIWEYFILLLGFRPVISITFRTSCQ